MRYTLKNDGLTVEVESQGAELMSIQTADGTEYLWQGDPKYWASRSPNLFPMVGRLNEARYTYEGKSYDITIHGFVRRAEMECVEHTPDRLVLALRDNDETRAVYPFAFEYRVIYTLSGSKIGVEYAVHNSDQKPIYFGLGAHPGFNVPLEPGFAFEDYYLEFAEAHTPNLQIFTETCLATGNKEPYPLVDDRRLPLRHHLFDNDALIFSDICRSLTLKCDQGCRAVQVDFPELPYLGIWHKPKTDAPYVCIEPWLSLPGRCDEITALEKKEDFVCLQPGGDYSNSWSITIY